jgi:hypothetical protein
MLALLHAMVLLPVVADHKAASLHEVGCCSLHACTTSDYGQQLLPVSPPEWVEDHTCDILGCDRVHGSLGGAEVGHGGGINHSLALCCLVFCVGLQICIGVGWQHGITSMI